MAQETYLIAKTVLQRVKGSSEVLNLDFVSPSTLAACSRAAQNLQRLNITVEEEEIVSQCKTVEEVQEFIAQYMSEVNKRRHHHKAWKKVYAFSQFAGPVLEVFKQANFSPECSLALGLVGMLLIQPLNNKSEIEDRLEIEIAQLQDILSQVKFSKGNIKSAEMDVEVQGLCAAIIDFLVHALHYQKKWSIAKVLGSIIADFAKRFQSFVSKIRGHASKIEVLAQREYTMTLLDSKETLDRVAQMIQDLQTRVIVQATMFDRRASRLEDNITQCKRAIETSTRFSAIQHVQQLSALLLPSLPPSFESEALFIRHQETLLAPRERWESNVTEIRAPGWLSQSPRPILWFGGRQNRRGVTWVSSFTLDLVEALQMERSVEVIYVLCNTGQDGPTLGPLSVFKRSVLQLLKAFPEIILVPENLDMLSAQRFEAVGESPEAAYKIMVDVLRMVDVECQRNHKEIFLLIDRVDIVLAKETPQEKQRFFKALLQLNKEYKMLRIVLTSQFPVAEMELQVRMDGRDAVMELWVDTTRPMAMSTR